MFWDIYTVTYQHFFVYHLFWVHSWTWQPSILQKRQVIFWSKYCKKVFTNKYFGNTKVYMEILQTLNTKSIKNCKYKILNYHSVSDIIICNTNYQGEFLALEKVLLLVLAVFLLLVLNIYRSSQLITSKLKHLPKYNSKQSTRRTINSMMHTPNIYPNSGDEYFNYWDLTTAISNSNIYLKYTGYIVHKIK